MASGKIINSIPAPMWDATCVTIPRLHRTAIFNSRTRSECDFWRCCYFEGNVYFNSRTRSECDQSTQNFGKILAFQFLHSRGVRPWCDSGLAGCGGHFNSCTRAECDAKRLRLYFFDTSFNSRTRAECDHRYCKVQPFSISAPSQGATQQATSLS